MLNLNQLKHDVARSSLHPLIPHVGISKIRVALGAWLYLEGEFLNPRDDFLGLAEVALAADYLPLALAAGTGLGVHVVVASSQLDSASYPTLPATLLTGDNIVGVLSTGSLAVRAGYLLLN